MPAQPSGIRCFTYSSFEHTNNAGPEGHPADRSVNSDQNAHLNQQSRRPRRNRAANPSEPSRAIKAQPHPALPGQPKTYGSRLRGFLVTPLNPGFRQFVSGVPVPLTVVANDEEYVLNLCTKYLARDNTDARHDFAGEYEAGDPRGLIAEAWRFPIVDSYWDGDPGSSYRFDAVTFVWDALRFPAG